jgi:tRNA1(Val) A37 N6-methylase TrmN6
MVKEEFDKLLEARFIRLMKITKWVSFVVMALKKNGKLYVCVNYKALNKVIKKDPKHKNDLINTLCQFLKSFWKRWQGTKCTHLKMGTRVIIK